MRHENAGVEEAFRRQRQRSENDLMETELAAYLSNNKLGTKEPGATAILTGPCSVKISGAQSQSARHRLERPGRSRSAFATKPFLYETIPVPLTVLDVVGRIHVRGGGCDGSVIPRKGNSAGE